MKLIDFCLMIPLGIDLLCGLNVIAQRVYPEFCPSNYYNMDTTRIITGEKWIQKQSFTSDELQRVLDDSWNPNSEYDTIPYNNVSCFKTGIFALPIIIDDNLDSIIHQLIDSSYNGGYSNSPDSLISRGLFFHIILSYETDRIEMEIELESNYYLGSSFEYYKKEYKDNIMACFHQGVLGIVTVKDDVFDNIFARNFFYKTGYCTSLHLYQKNRQILLDSSCSDKDVHSTAYGLYRRYVFDNNKWIESY